MDPDLSTWRSRVRQLNRGVCLLHATNPSDFHRVLQMGWGNQGGDPDMFGMWMEDLGEEQNSDMDDVSEPLGAASHVFVLSSTVPFMYLLQVVDSPD